MIEADSTFSYPCFEWSSSWPGDIAAQNVSNIARALYIQIVSREDLDYVSSTLISEPNLALDLKSSCTGWPKTIASADVPMIATSMLWVLHRMTIPLVGVAWNGRSCRIDAGACVSCLDPFIEDSWSARSNKESQRRRLSDVCLIKSSDLSIPRQHAVVCS